VIQEPCPNKCGLWVAKKDIKNHSYFLCRNTEVKCENCEVLEKPFPHESFKHNCFSILMKKVKAFENK
jgi:competence transcription factor ComK